MKSVKIFKAGNSLAVTIPKELALKYGLELGLRVFPEVSKQGIIFKSMADKRPVLPSDLNGWLKKFDKKHFKALRSLANR